MVKQKAGHNMAGQRIGKEGNAARQELTNGSGPGTLYVVATPIGNLEDITLRAVRVLGAVALVAAEDTRQTKKLLSHLGISVPVISYYRHREASRAEQIIDHLRQGQDVALVSDAGTPGIADPGAVLIARAREEQLPVVPIPGACALVTAISAAGLAESEFSFHGFLPSRTSQRRKALERLASLAWPVVFYEAPHRIEACLGDCLELLGNRQATIGRELTKLHEEILHGSLVEIRDSLAGRDRVRGEFVVIVHGAAPEQPCSVDLADVLGRLRDQGLSLRDAVRLAVTETGLPKKEIYNAALALWP